LPGDRTSQRSTQSSHNEIAALSSRQSINGTFGNWPLQHEQITGAGESGRLHVTIRQKSGWNFKPMSPA
jgi:hypothetical protein